MSKTELHWDNFEDMINLLKFISYRKINYHYRARNVIELLKSRNFAQLDTSAMDAEIKQAKRAFSQVPIE